MVRNNKEIAVEVKNLTKTYPGVIANKSVDFKVYKGEIHALVGENGAGKSTLMKILYGIEQPDEGELFVNEEKVEINKVDKAIKLGIGMVHQEFHLVPSFTAAENIGLGQEPRNSNGLINWEKLNQDVSSISEKYGLDVDPNLRMIDASVGIQQRAEILKDIDDKMIKLLDLEDKELPWLNCNDLPTKWVKIMEDLRLVVAKLKYEQFQDERIVN